MMATIMKAESNGYDRDGENRELCAWLVGM